MRFASPVVSHRRMGSVGFALDAPRGFDPDNDFAFGSNGQTTNKRSMGMMRSEFEALCVACARDLQERYGDGLVDSVRAALVDGERSGRPRDMITLSVNDVTGIASLIVSMASLVVAYISLKEAQKSSGAPTQHADDAPTQGADPQTTAPDELPQISADLPRIERTLDEAVADLGEGQRTVAIQVKLEFFAWLTRRSKR